VAGYGVQTAHSSGSTTRANRDHAGLRVPCCDHSRQSFEVVGRKVGSDVEVTRIDRYAISDGRNRTREHEPNAPIPELLKDGAYVEMRIHAARV
jgi:hypothetical protein